MPCAAWLPAARSGSLSSPSPHIVSRRGRHECALAHACPANCQRSVAHRRLAQVRLMLRRPRRNTMLIRSAIATAVFAALTAGCTPPQAQKGPAVNDKTYGVTPGAITVKSGVLSGALTEMKVVERVEDGSGRIDTPARLTGKPVRTNISNGQNLRLLGGSTLQ